MVVFVPLDFVMLVDLMTVELQILVPQADSSFFAAWVVASYQRSLLHLAYPFP